jgi:cardiolipin synthase
MDRIRLWPLSRHWLTVDTVGFVSALAAAAHLLVTLAVSVRVVMKRRPPGVSLAWLILVAFLPYAGAVLYLLFGERPLGRERNARARSEKQPAIRMLGELVADELATVEEVPVQWQPIRRLADGAVGFPALGHNALTLLSDTQEILRAIAADIQAAQRFCLLEFYIWNPGGTADEVAEAIMAAARRGVRCRVLLDDVGSGAFWKSPWPDRMTEAGVELRRALPVGLVRAAFRRADLRLHRKSVVVDGRIGYTGSLNLVDPRYFKQDSGVGHWVDAMARMEGPAVSALQGLFLWDWAMESDETMAAAAKGLKDPAQRADGSAVVQLVPSGPAFEGAGVVQLLRAAVWSAQRELVLTTPYFVPDEPLVAAIIAAAQRGVRVRLIVPARVDSFLVRHASRSFYQDLLEAGVEILLFEGGLLHTKSIVADGELAFFGTLNLDIRSFLLNFEMTLIVYDKGFASRLGELQSIYARDSRPLTLAELERRSFGQRFIENTLQLMSPLL